MRIAVRLLLPVIVITWLVGMSTLSMSSDVAPASVSTYIGNTRSFVFHRQSCRHLPHKENRTYFDTRKEAIDTGYRPCRKCRP
ncbi:MAG: Ada metal-binding domain-containing protein [Armatimonadota bacterium]